LILTSHESGSNNLKAPMRNHHLMDETSVRAATVKCD
jgi:hypothetical protein